MNKSLTVGILAAAVLLVGVAATGSLDTLFSNDELTAAASASAKTLVTYSDNGFTPRVFTVARGTSVQFINTGGKALRLAPHSDEAYKTAPNNELTASRSIKIGESYEVSVTAPGVWAFKNANHPGDIGIVVVE